MRAEDLMTRKLCVVTPDVPVKDVARLLAQRGVGAAPVVSATGELVGIVTEADLIALQARPDSLRHVRRDRWHRPAAPGSVGEVMSAPVVAARVDTDVADIVAIMLGEHITRVPILDADGALVGLVSRSDLLRLLARPDQEIADDARDAVAAAGVCAQPRIEVLDGHVLITEVDPEHRTLVDRLVRNVPGVLGVDFVTL